MEQRYNPFNPQLPAKPREFVGRNEEIQKFVNYLYQTMNGSPMNLAIIGNRGIGKTSLLTKYEQIAKENNCLVVKVSNFKGNITDIRALADYLLQNLRREIMIEKARNLSKVILDFFATYDVGIAYADLSLELQKREAILMGLFKEKLEKIWDKIKNDYKAVVFLIDEAESIENLKGSSALMFLREVFQRLGQEECHYMLVLCGKLSFAHNMAEAFSPLNRFFPRMELKNLNYDEIKDYSTNQLSLVNIRITDEAIKKISDLSEGHPYVLVNFCYTLFDVLPITSDLIDENILNRAVPIIKENLKNDFFYSLFYPLASKSKKILIFSVKRLNKRIISYKEIVGIMNEDGSQISPYIQKLIERGSLNYIQRGQYEIFHGLYMEFIKTLQDREKEILQKTLIS